MNEEIIGETIDESKVNITVQLKNIGVLAGQLLQSPEAKENNKLFKELTGILKFSFNILFSIDYLERYIYNNTDFKADELIIYNDFNEFRTATYKIIVAINDLSDFKGFTKESDKNRHIILKNSCDLLEYRYKKLLEVRRELNRRGGVLN